MSKLTNAQVLEIRTRYAAGGVKQADLAAEYGIGKATINYILQGKSYINAGGPLITKKETKKYGTLHAGKVEEIRRRYVEEKVSAESLGNEYDVSGDTILRAVRGETWKGAGGPISK